MPKTGLVKSGGLFLPRVGQEVLVDFINGDPDQPIISGAV
ncbi:phage baseplate assembly protein V [Pseudoalteromonas sp. B193]